MLPRISNLLTILGIFSISFCLTALPADIELIPLPREKYLDKCKGAWLGQMIGVTFADRYEFQFNGIPILGPLEQWKPEDIKRAFPQDDLYVEMTFLETLEQKGINISYNDAGKFFAESKYPLWHANKAGRENVRNGIQPPFSGHPEYNSHADDIDFQIESDLFGIICPGLPKEAQKIGKIFGSVMNYGDGLYGGLFFAGMYASAFFNEDIEKVVLSGLECIPAESTYRKCIEDTIEGWRKNPENWLETWKFIEQKWQDDSDCIPGHPVNIDAKINGAYVVMGLLYGKGDLQKTLEIATRCGQDTDCNASSAGGILGCIKGFSNIEEQWKSYLNNVEDEKFLFTNYSWKTLISACEKITKEIITHAGGKIDNEIFYIPLQKASPPPTLEQWIGKKETCIPPIPSTDMKKWGENWRVKSCKKSSNVGVFIDDNTATPYLSLIQPDPNTPVIIESLAPIPQAKKLKVGVKIPKNGIEFSIRLRADYKIIEDRKINSTNWTEIVFNISPYNNTTTVLTIEAFSSAENEPIQIKPPQYE
ncbi:MAG: ADP-ribosylglycohydrolase family protein [Candidatus Hydrogenedentes bacterium]|nr:ADP-ribosylglycohydrolase family protein [Candidatus Hydrogenedentota bacterium]